MIETGSFMGTFLGATARLCSSAPLHRCKSAVNRYPGSHPQRHCHLLFSSAVVASTTRFLLRPSIFSLDSVVTSHTSVNKASQSCSKSPRLSGSHADQEAVGVSENSATSSRSTPSTGRASSETRAPRPRKGTLSQSNSEAASDRSWHDANNPALIAPAESVHLDSSLRIDHLRDLVSHETAGGKYSDPPVSSRVIRARR